MGKIYHYHPVTKVYTAVTDAIPDSADPTKDTVPAHATSVAPVGTLTADQSHVWQGTGWTIMSNYTGQRLYRKDNAAEVENTLKVGDLLPADLTNQSPRFTDFPLWDPNLNKWVEDTKGKELADYQKELSDVTFKLEAALRILEDNEARKRIPGIRVLSDPNETHIRGYITLLQDYIDRLTYTGPRAFTTWTGTVPPWPLPGEPDTQDMSIYDTDNAGPVAGLTALPWAPGTEFAAGSLIYSTTGDGLFVAPHLFTSNPAIGTDISQGNIISVVPKETGLRYAPVQDIASLAALVARDYAICKVLQTSDEYVFIKGATQGDVRDNQATGYWQKVTSMTAGRYLTYMGTVATPSFTFVIGTQPFTVQHELIFVNGTLRQGNEYSIDWTSGTVTLVQEMQQNDVWKVLVMS